MDVLSLTKREFIILPTKAKNDFGGESRCVRTWKKKSFAKVLRGCRFFRLTALQIVILEHGKLTLDNCQWSHGFSVLEQRSDFRYFLVQNVPSSFLAMNICPQKCSRQPWSYAADSRQQGTQFYHGAGREMEGCAWISGNGVDAELERQSPWRQTRTNHLAIVWAWLSLPGHLITWENTSKAGDAHLMYP